MIRYGLLPSPLGELLVARDEVGLTCLYLSTGRHSTGRHSTGPHSTGRHPQWQRADDAFPDVRAQLDEYFAGARQDFELALHPRGTPFQLRAWAALRVIRYGETATYGQQATRLGTPTAFRAVGAANGQNPISIVVPCHRVIGANGALVGYGGGLDAKRWLLSHEAAHTGLFAS